MELTKKDHQFDENSSLFINVKRNKYLVFNLTTGQFAVPLTLVKEVVGMMEITTIPHVPSYFKGLINLRGRIISVIDLREKLGLKINKQDVDSKQCIIITEVGDLVMGVVVDDVLAVIGYEESQIERKIDIQSNVSKEFILGVAKSSDQHLTLLLDLSKILNADELEVIKKKMK